MNSRLIIVNHIGTSVTETIESEIYPLIDEIKNIYKDVDVILSFSSLRSRNKLQKKGVFIKGIEEAIESGIAKGYKEILLLPLHVVGGADYQKSKEYIESIGLNIINNDQKIKVLEPLIASESDCKRLANAIYNTLSIEDRHKKLLFMGHGTLHSTDSYYKILEKQLCLLNLDVKVTTLNHLKNLSQEALQTEINMYMESGNDITKEENEKEIDKEIVVFPLFAVSGHHVKRDLFEGPSSIMERLEKLGVKGTIYDKGLVVYSRVKSLYFNRLSQ